MSDVIPEFWRSFLDHKAELENLESADDPTYDTLLASLQKIDQGLFFAFCTEPGANEFIVSADGNEELFSLVEDIVRQAPEVDGWQIIALKPQLGFPETTRWEDVEIVIGDVLVLPVFNPAGEMGLRLYAPGFSEADSTSIHNAILQALDSGLGERQFAQLVKGTWVHPIEEAPAGAFPLPDLSDYLEKRNR
jgi:hypothetical protein